MNCEAVVKSIPLYFYGELSPEAEENVEAHCASCESCQGEIETFRSFSTALNESELEPSPDLLLECRQMLASRIQEDRVTGGQRKQTWWSRIQQWLAPARVPITATALVALGFVGAKIMPTSFQGHVPEEATSSTIRSVEPSPSGGVQISVDNVEHRVVSGDKEDRRIRELLLSAVREETNPGVRVESVDVLKNMAGQEDVRTALLDAVQHDPNPGVRLKALEGLKQFSTNQSVRKTLTAVLMNDSNPGVRMEVVDVLVKQPDDSTIGMMQKLVRKEDNGYVRIRLERALQNMNASVGTF